LFLQFFDKQCLMGFGVILVILGGYSLHLAERQAWIKSSSAPNQLDDVIWAWRLPGRTHPDLDYYSQTKFASFNNCCWLAIVTVTTLGYGKTI
jgi:hypothetical protein